MANPNFALPRALLPLDDDDEGQQERKRVDGGGGEADEGGGGGGRRRRGGLTPVMPFACRASDDGHDNLDEADGLSPRAWSLGVRGRTGRVRGTRPGAGRPEAGRLIQLAQFHLHDKTIRSPGTTGSRASMQSRVDPSCTCIWAASAHRTPSSSFQPMFQEALS